MENIVHLQIYEFFDFYNLLQDIHFRFRKGFSTESAVRKLYDVVVRNFVKKNFLEGVFLVSSTVLDTLNRQILLHKLSYDGIDRAQCHGLGFTYQDDHITYVCVVDVEVNYIESSLKHSLVTS